MPAKTDAFVHTDDRFFVLKSERPHTTRDGRNITLTVWETSCSHPDCAKTLEVSTATDTPWTWPNFNPAKYCPAHRNQARSAAMKTLIKARSEGLARWRASPEGKQVLAEKKANGMGTIERAIYEATVDLSMAGDAPQWGDVVALVKAQMAVPEEGARDTRYQRIRRALWSLREKKRLYYRSGVVILQR